MPNVYQQAAAFRKALIARDKEAAQAMADAYDLILERLEREWAALVATFDDNASDWHLRRNERFKALIAQVERELGFYARVVEQRVTGRQIQEALLGAQDAAAMVETVSVGASFNTLNTGAVQAIVANLQDVTPVSAVLKDFAGANAEYIKRALLYSVAAGRNPRTLARQISKAFELPKKRALLISRTETLRAYRQASQATFEANSDIVKQWRWVATKSARTCLNCLSRDGSLYPTSEIIPSHPNCRCVMAPVTRLTPPPKETGAQWFARQSPATQREMMSGKAFELFEQGKITLKDFEGRKDDDKWGAITYQRSLKQITALQARRKAV